MAIKGKKKSRGGGRGVAAPPRPALVAPRTPLLKRTSFRITLIVVLLGLLIMGAVLGVSARNRARDRQAAQDAVRQFQTRLEAALTAKGVGQDLGTGFVILPEFGQRLSAVQTGDVGQKEITDLVEKWTADVNEAASTVAAIDPGATLVSDEIADIRDRLRQGLVLYVGMAKELAVAATLDGKARDDLVAALQEQFATAAGVWDGGWQALQSLRADLGISDPAPAAPPGGIPGGIPGQPPGGIPGGIPGQPPGGIPGQPPGEIPGAEGASS